jgi:molybdopterin molybdotransferase
MFSLAEARALIVEKISPLPAMVVPWHRAGGGVLRQDVLAAEDVPGFDRSAMDGYAVAREDASKKFRIVAEIQPGVAIKYNIGRGECARIFTGAPIPAGASQVLMQETVRVEGGFMIPAKRGPATYIRHRGEDARRGDRLLKTGIRLGAGELALLAGVGQTRVKISAPVRVAHFATGNEVVAPERQLKPGQIRDANSIMVATLVGQLGGKIIKQARVADDLEQLLKKTRALKTSYDLLLISGGASVGNYDFGKKLLTALGFKIHFTTINLRPGKPLVFATRGRQAAFVVPGNPVSHFVTFCVAIRLAFERFTGAPISWPMATARLAGSLTHQPGPRETFWPARVTLRKGELVARALRWQSSGDVTGLAGVNALLQLRANAKAPVADEDVCVLMLEIP